MRSKNESSCKIDSVLLLLVSGLTQADLEAAAIEKLGIDPGDVADVIAAARRRLKDAADFDQAERLGESITRLNDLYARCIRGQDLRTALQAQKELNRLLDLHGSRAAKTGDVDRGPDLDFDIDPARYRAEVQEALAASSVR